MDFDTLASMIIYSNYESQGILEMLYDYETKGISSTIKTRIKAVHIFKEELYYGSIY